MKINISVSRAWFRWLIKIVKWTFLLFFATWQSRMCMLGGYINYVFLTDLLLKLWKCALFILHTCKICQHALTNYLWPMSYLWNYSYFIYSNDPVPTIGEKYWTTLNWLPHVSRVHSAIFRLSFAHISVLLIITSYRIGTWTYCFSKKSIPCIFFTWHICKCSLALIALSIRLLMEDIKFWSNNIEYMIQSNKCSWHTQIVSGHMQVNLLLALQKSQNNSHRCSALWMSFIEFGISNALCRRQHKCFCERQSINMI